MAFCTKCGATVQGAFCQQCGTPASPSAAPSAPSPVAPMGAAPVPAAQMKRKTSAVVWVLLAVAGIIVLGIVGAIAAGIYFVKNPGMVMAKAIQAANPDAEVLETDMGSQTLRIRDRRTGKEFTLSFNDVKNGKFKISATDEDGKIANVEIGGGPGNLPKWVPAYPGAKAQANITGKGEDRDGMGEGGVVTFTTPDSPAQVTSFYQEKFKELGMPVEVSNVTDSGSMLVGKDEDGGRTLHVMVGRGSGDTSITVTFGRKR